MSSATTRFVVITSVVATTTPACRDGAVRSDTDARVGEAAASSPVALLAPPADAPPPPRCVRVKDGARADVSFGVGEELGEAIPVKGGFALGMLRASEAGRVASVARVASTSATRVDLGDSWGDAPAPQPLLRGEDLYAVAYVKPRGASSTPSAAGPRTRRTLSVFHLDAIAERTLELPPESDASSSYDAIAAPLSTSPVGAIVAWDEDVGTPPRGVVDLAVLSPDLRALRGVRAVATASEAGTPASYAGDPRLAAREGGYWLAWLARRPEHAVAALPLPAGEVETPSEEATYGWIEAVALDAQGAVLGAPRRLTPSTGHVGKYALHPYGGSLVVVAEDDGPASTRGGGALEQVVWHGGSDEPLDRARLVRSGVEEETPPSIVTGVGGDVWLTFLDVGGETLLRPLGPFPPSTGSGLTSTNSRVVETAEPLLSRGRILGAVDGRLALAASDGARWTLGWASCSRHE